MTRFLLAFDRSRSSIIERHDFAEADLESAWKAREEMIHRYFAQPEIEIVLLGSDSEETLRKTHGRYFEGPLDPAA